VISLNPRFGIGLEGSCSCYSNCKVRPDAKNFFRPWLGYFNPPRWTLRKRCWTFSLWFQCSVSDALLFDVFSMFLIYHLVALATLLSCVLDVNATSCKCVSWADDCFATPSARRFKLIFVKGPNDTCWPPASEWKSLNASVSGKLIADSQPAASCYPGILQDAAACGNANAQWGSQKFQTESPIGLTYPTGSCPIVPFAAGANLIGVCTIGDQPWYTVNATEYEDVAKGILFARKHNIRLVVRNTGHDLLGR